MTKTITRLVFLMPLVFSASQLFANQALLQKRQEVDNEVLQIVYGTSLNELPNGYGVNVTSFESEDGNMSFDITVSAQKEESITEQIEHIAACEQFIAIDSIAVDIEDI